MCAVGSPDGQGKSFPIVEAIVDGTVPSVPWIMVLHRPQLTIVIHGTDKISILMPRISSLAVSSGSYVRTDKCNASGKSPFFCHIVR